MLRRSGRVRKILIAVLGVLVVIGAVGLAILPEIVRRIAVSQAAKVTGRVLSLEDVDLNLFTGHLALKGGKVLKRGMNERALEFERLDVRVDYLPLVLRNVHGPAGILFGTLAHQISDHESAKGERRVIVGQCHTTELFNLGSAVTHGEAVGEHGIAPQGPRELNGD